MFTGPVGPVEVFFYWPEDVFGNFYWPGAIVSPLASSPGILYGFCKRNWNKSTYFTHAYGQDRLLKRIDISERVNSN